jgi:polysaccharide export outer membrane protein
MSFESGPRQWAMMCGLLAAGLFWAGCHTSASQLGDPRASAAPPPTAPPATAGAADDSRPAGPAAVKTTSDLLRVGDSVNITMRDLPDKQEPIEAIIKEDGSITLPLLEQQVRAAGKTTGELEKAIWNSYVPRYYKHLTVIVRAQGQFYSVKGEVKLPNRYPYINATTVLKAITSAGDFTDFARKRRVKVFRHDGRIEIEDCIKALQNPSLDLPVYPGDLINVERRKPWQR